MVYLKDKLNGTFSYLAAQLPSADLSQRRHQWRIPGSQFPPLQLVGAVFDLTFLLPWIIGDEDLNPLTR